MIRGKTFSSAFLAAATASIIIISHTSFLRAEQVSTPSMRASFGAGVSGGYSDVVISGTTSETWSPGPVYGGGIIFEWMWSEYFGLHSGVWFYRVSQELEFESSTDVTTADSNILTLPVYLTAAQQWGRFGISVLAGFDFGYIWDTELSNDSSANPERADITHYMNKNQFAVSAGLDFRFGIGRFTYLFVGGMASFYCTNLIDGDDQSDIRLYTFTAHSGILLRTF